MKFCMYCGCEMEDEDLFCMRCGKSQNDSEEAETEPNISIEKQKLERTENKLQNKKCNPPKKNLEGNNKYCSRYCDSILSCNWH